MKNVFLLFALIILFASCEQKASIEDLKEEIINTENEFAQMVKEKGIAEAFQHFAAENAVMNRNDTLIVGKEAIKEYFKDQVLKDVNLEWTPDYVDVAASGDLAYTYGKYVFTAQDTSGRPIKGIGIFHTVWKRQDDGSWKFVWD